MFFFSLPALLSSLFSWFLELYRDEKFGYLWLTSAATTFVKFTSLYQPRSDCCSACQVNLQASNQINQIAIHTLTPLFVFRCTCII